MKQNSLKQFPQYINHLQTNGQYWFLRSEVQQTLGLSNNAITKALCRLAKKKTICRIRGDFYVIVPLEYQALGCLPVEWFIDAFMQHMGFYYYVALLSAASLEGAAHQQVMDFQVITNGRLRSIIAGTQRITFHYKKELPMNYLQQKKSPASYFNVSKPELTAFDLVRYMNAAGQLNVAATVLYEFSSKKLNMQIMCELIELGHIKLPVAQRLGYILEFIHADLDLENLWQVINYLKPKYVPLLSDFNKKTIKEHNKRWHVLVNEIIEIDEI